MTREQAGAATILAVAMMGLLVTVTVAAAGVVGVVAAHRRAQSAADLSALAGASALRGGGDPCERAGVIAKRNDTTLRRCQVDDWTVAVVVSGALRLPGGTMELKARGRAGPVNARPRISIRPDPTTRVRLTKSGKPSAESRSRGSICVTGRPTSSFVEGVASRERPSARAG